MKNYTLIYYKFLIPFLFSIVILFTIGCTDDKEKVNKYLELPPDERISIEDVYFHESNKFSKEPAQTIKACFKNTTKFFEASGSETNWNLIAEQTITTKQGKTWHWECGFGSYELRDSKCTHLRVTHASRIRETPNIVKGNIKTYQYKLYLNYHKERYLVSERVLNK